MALSTEEKNKLREAWKGLIGILREDLTHIYEHIPEKDDGQLYEDVTRAADHLDFLDRIFD